MFSLFNSSVFGDPFKEAHAFMPDRTDDGVRGRVVGNLDGKLLVKLENTNNVIQVSPTDIIKVLQK